VTRARLFAVGLALLAARARADEPPPGMVPVDEPPAPPLGTTRIDEPANAPSLPPSSPASSDGVVRFTAGAGLRNLYRQVFYGGEVQAAFGRERGRNAYYFSLSLLAGASQYALVACHPQIGFLWERLFDGVRAGIGVNTGWLVLRRATTGQPLGPVTHGLRFVLSFDVHRSDSGSVLFLGGQAGIYADFFAAPTADVGLVLGVRL
jgi:hypothetical protein